MRRDDAGSRPRLLPALWARPRPDEMRRTRTPQSVISLSLPIDCLLYFFPADSLAKRTALSRLGRCYRLTYGELRAFILPALEDAPSDYDADGFAIILIIATPAE